MLSKKMVDTVNAQINKEIYPHISIWQWRQAPRHPATRGAAVWLKVQFHEEMVHAMKFYEYVMDQGGILKLMAIAEPQAKYSSLLEIFEKTLAHEQVVTKSINDLMELAIQEKDHASRRCSLGTSPNRSRKKKNCQEILQTLEMIGGNTSALYLYDKELGARMVTVPTDFSKGVTAAMGGA